jgi:membrane protease YdiL (CAAX protease family)
MAVTRRRTWWELAIVLGLSLGASAVYAIVALIADLSSGKSLADQSAALNTSQSPVPWLDVTYQLLAVFFDLFPVALALYLLWMPGRNAFETIGLTWRRPGRDLGNGLLLAAAIGIPGLAFYALGRLAGLTVSVQASPLDPHWWTIPVLVLAAVRAALQEEVIVVGYLSTRLRGDLEWGKWPTIIASAALRGSYHLYQGVGPFFGNAVMGVVFGWVYAKWGRTAPLVVAHAVLDIVSFVGYPLAASLAPGIFR